MLSASFESLISCERFSMWVFGIPLQVNCLESGERLSLILISLDAHPLCESFKSW